MNSDPDIIEFDVCLDSPLVIWEAEVEFLHQVFLDSEHLLKNHIINHEVRAKASEKSSLSKLGDKNSRYKLHCEHQADLENQLEIFNGVCKRYFRNHFLVALCGIYETSLQELANYINGTDKKRCDISDKKKEEPTNKYLVRFFREELHIEIFSKESNYESIMETAYRIRNIVAHKDSYIDEKGKDKKTLSQLACIDRESSQQLGMFGSDVLVLTTAYIEKIFAVVESVFEEIKRHDKSLLANK